MPDDCPEVGPPFNGTCDDLDLAWVEVDSIQSDLVPTGAPDLQFRLFANRFKSSSPDCEYFLHDPLRHMLLKPGALKALPGWPDITSDDPGERAEFVASLLEEDSEGRSLRDKPQWHITTFLSNHHRKLTKVHFAVLAIVGGDGIHLLGYKDTDQSRADFS